MSVKSWQGGKEPPLEQSSLSLQGGGELPESCEQDLCGEGKPELCPNADEDPACSGNLPIDITIFHQKSSGGINCNLSSLWGKNLWQEWEFLGQNCGRSRKQHRCDEGHAAAGSWPFYHLFLPLQWHCLFYAWAEYWLIDELGETSWDPENNDGNVERDDEGNIHNFWLFFLQSFLDSFLNFNFQCVTLLVFIRVGM